MTQIAGEVRVANGLPASGLEFGLYRERFGAAPELLAELTTRDDGAFTGPDLDLDAATTLTASVHRGDADIALTPIGTQDPTALRLVVPTDAAGPAFAAEFTRLNDAVAPVLGGSSLAAAREDDTRQDLTFLHRASGWDARLVATAATAARLSGPVDDHDAGTGIDGQALYGLLRTGLPSDPALLATVPSATVAAALDRSAAAGLIDLDVDARAAAVQQFDRFARTRALGSKPAGGVSTVAEMLDAAKLPTRGNDARRIFESLVLGGPSEDGQDLWARASAAGMKDATVRSLRLQGKLAFLTTNNAPLMAAVSAGADDVDALGAHLAEGRWDRPATWSAAVEQLGGATAVPATFQDDDDPVAAYSDELARRVRVAYPTQVVGGMLRAGDISVAAAAEAPAALDATVADTLITAGDRGLRLGATPVASFLADNADLLSDLADDTRDHVESALLTLNRVYQLSPSNEAMKALLDNGLTSASDISRFSETDFVNRYGSLFPSEPQARLVHRKAVQVDAVIYTFFSMTRQAASAPLPIVSGSAEHREAGVAALKDALPHLPTMESLFGAMDFCECDDCRSVLSPAAYLVDLFAFLDPSDLDWRFFTDQWAVRHGGAAYPYGKPFDELDARRPDLARLQLSCENTTSELSVIDIVNEILEYVVAHDDLAAGAVRDSGAVASADVLAEPEFVVDAAYESLRAATYPLALPFDVWHETARGFLDWLDAPLAPLHEAFRDDETLGGGRYEAVVDRLRLTRAAADVITASAPLAAWWTRLGYGPQPAQQAVAGADLGSAKNLARRLGVTYLDLAELLETQFVNPRLGALGVLSTAGVSIADAVFWRKHQALAVQPKPADDDARRDWERVRSVQERLDAVTAAHALMGSRAADAWLAALPDAALAAVVLLASDGTMDFGGTVVASAATGAPLAVADLGELAVRLEVFLRLRSALGWSTADLDRALVAFTPGGVAGPSVFGAPLQTALVLLSHVVELAELLDVDETARASLVALWAPLDTRGGDSTYARLFLSAAPAQRDPVFAAPLGDVLSADAVAAAPHLVDHLAALHAATGMTPGEMQTVLRLDDAAWAAASLTLDAVSDLVRHRWLADALGMTIGDLVALRDLGALEPFPAAPAAPLTTFQDDPVLHGTLPFVADAQRLIAAGVAITDLDYLLAHRGDGSTSLPADPAATLATLKAVAAAIRESVARAAKAAPEGAPRPDPRPFAAAAVGAALGGPPGVVSALVHGPDALPDPAGGAGATLADALVGEGFLGDGFQAVPTDDPAQALALVPEAAAAMLLLSKVLLLADRFALSPRECRVLGLTALPLAPVVGPAPLYPSLRSLLDHLDLRAALRGGSMPDALAGVLEAAAASGAGASRRDAAIAAFAVVARRPASAVTDAVATLGLTADDLATPAGLARLWSVLRSAALLGVDAATLESWLPITTASASVDERRRIARGIKDTARAHLGPSRWRQTAKPVSDRLRQRQRDALVAAVLHAHGYESVEELYQALLIDPGSEPVLRTSRIRQAISSVQLFVQRCLLGLEPRVHPSALKADQWEWLKRYRVWEANRKIFLFPENWLEPEFRDDKSHLFTELESTLLQNDVTADVVEDALLMYLRRLDEIARLDIVAFCTEQDIADISATTLHVIGRTHGGPHQYFSRRLSHGIWTPWEPVGIDIEGDHVVPVMWRGRLHLFWVTFLQSADDSASNPTSSGLGVKATLDLATIGFGIVAGATQAKEPELASATAGQIRSSTAAGGVSRRVDVQLHWSEYLKGRWSPPTAGGFGRVSTYTTNGVFDPSSVFVHSSTLFSDDGEEAGVQIHLTGGMIRTFLLRGRNSVPEPGANQAAPAVPYSAARASVNRWLGSDRLTVTFAQRMTSTDGGAETPTSATRTVLGKAGGYQVIPSANAISVAGGDIGSLVSPYFFADARRTFFVQPSLTETTTESWEEWVVPDPDNGTTIDPGIIEGINLQPYIPPKVFTPIGGPDEWWREPDPWRGLYTTLPTDTFTSPTMGLLYGDTLVGSRGGVGLSSLAVVAGPALGGGNVVGGNVVGRAGSVIDRIHVVDDDGIEAADFIGAAADGGLQVTGITTVHTAALSHVGIDVAAGSQITVVGPSGFAHALPTTAFRRLQG